MRSIFRRFTVAGAERPMELDEAKARLSVLLASTDPDNGVQTRLAAVQPCSLAEASDRIARLTQ